MDRPRNFFVRIFRRAGELEKNSFMLFIIMMFGNFLNYLFQIIMGGLLDVEDYGRLSALLSIIAILSVISGVMTMVTAKYTVEYVHHERLHRLRYLFISILKVIAVFAGAILLLGIVFSSVISRELKIGNDILVIATVIASVVSLFTSVVLGILQGLKRFFHFGMTSFLAILGKFAFGIALVLIGLQLYGPITAIILGMFISFGYGIFQIRSQIIRPENDGPEPFPKQMFFRFVGKVIVIQVCISLITNGDILLVKYFFSEQEAGIYSSAMMIGKISLYAATAIVAALFPMTMEKVVKGVGAKRLLFKSLLYSGGIAVLCALVLNLFPDFIINILYGQKYLSSAPLLLPISSLVIPVTIFTILMNYQMATGKTRVLSITLIGCIVLSGVLVQFFHSSIPQMIYCLAAVLAVGAVADAVILFISKQVQTETKND